MHTYYYDKDKISRAVDQGQHRELIGGMWDDIGDLQLAFLKSQGLKPHHRLLDIGCGSLRLGVRAVDYLDAGHYFGTDLNASLMQAGYDREIVPASLQDKLPRENLQEDSEFTFHDIPGNIDFAMATSVFTHLPLNHLRLCLTNLEHHLTGPCLFFFTIFTPPEGQPVVGRYEQLDGIVSYDHKDPYHYDPGDIAFAGRQTGWSFQFIGDWNHPRNQKIMLAKLDPARPSSHPSLLDRVSGLFASR